MAYIADYVFDLALTEIDTNADRIDICSTEPTTFAQATSTYSLGNSTSVVVGAPADRSPSGRRVTVSGITNGSITASGTAAYWALSDVSESRLLAAGSLTASQVVASGNTFTLTAFDIGIADAS